MKSPKIAGALFATLAAVLLVWLLDGEQQPATASPTVPHRGNPESTGQPSPSQSESAPMEALEAGMVRVEIHRPAAEPQLLVEIPHLGPLSQSDKQSLVGKLQFILERDAAKLDAAWADSNDSADLLRQARAHHLWVQSETAIAAIHAGSYLVVEDGKHSIPLSMEAGEISAIGHLSNSTAAVIMIIMPYERFPRLKDAKQYLEQTEDFHSSERAIRFNSLPEAERRVIAERILDIMRSRTHSKADREFLEEWGGYNFRVDPASLFLIPQR